MSLREKCICREKHGVMLHTKTQYQQWALIGRNASSLLIFGIASDATGYLAFVTLH
jgi:hypothetical protein